MQQPAYKYKPIDLGKTAIRLIHLHGGQYDNPIFCEIEEVLLGDEGVPYHAVSYTWGRNSFEESVNIVDPVDGSVRSLGITKSLFSALKHLRDRVQERWLWADGICIDQNNPKERAHQVSQMRRVYSEAERVIIWLGDFASDDPDDATASDIDVLMRYASRLDKKVISGMTPPFGTKAWEEQLHNEGVSAWAVGKMTTAMRTLLQNPWFKRVWIIQEVVSARSAVVVCGDNGYAHSISTRTFVLLPSLLGIDPDAQSQSILDVMPLLRGQRKGGWIRGANLQTLLVKFRDSQCSEQRDFIYALLGMAADGRTIIPDYEIQEEVVFANVLSYLLFGEVVSSKDYPLPGSKNALIEALTDPCGLSHHITMWALTNYHHMTTIRILELTDEHTEAKAAIKTRPGRPPRSAIAVSPGPVSILAKENGLFCAGEKNISSLLHLVTAQGNIHYVRRLLAHKGYNVNAKNEKGDTPLSVAIFRRDIDMLRLFLARKNIGVNTVNDRGETPLSIIVSRRDIELARMLLTRKDLKINTGDTGCDPLVRAVAEDDWAMAQLLLQHGANINPAKTLKPGPLMAAVSSNNTKAVRILLRHKYVAHRRRNAGGETGRAELLAAAIGQGNEEIARLLLEHSKASNLSKSEATELWLKANSSGHERIADLLREHNAPVDLDSYEGSETLMQAVRLHQFAAVDRLVKNGANPDRATASNPPTPLTLAIELHDVDMVSKLIECGADVNDVFHSLYHLTPLCHAARCGNLEIFELLIRHEHIDILTDIHHKHRNSRCGITIGSIALFKSVSIGHERIFERLWNHEALDVDVNREDYGAWEMNQPLLGVAAARDRLAIAKTIASGARGKVDVNQTDRSGSFTPLKEAARAGNASFAQWLLQFGSDEIDLEYGEHREEGTALWCAVEALSYEIAEILLEWGAKPDVECYGSGVDHSPEYIATPLWRAVYKGSVSMAELLLSKGARIDIKGRAKRQSLNNESMSSPHSPLVQAAYQKRANMVRLLIKHGAQPTDVDEIDDFELQSKLKAFIQKAVEDGGQAIFVNVS